MPSPATAPYLSQTIDHVSGYVSSSYDINFASTLSPDLSWDQTTIEGRSLLTVNGTNSTMSSEQCQAHMEKFREQNMMNFDDARLTRVLVTWAVFLLSAAGNCFVLTSVTVRRRRMSISHPQFMMMHLTTANLAFTVFIIPADAIWQTTVEWFGGDLLCRLTNVLKQFSMYSSSAMVVVMGFDRVANLMCPMSTAGQRRRIKIMLAIAWTFCFLNAIPAGVIFSVVRHAPLCPEYIVVQCVDMAIKNHTNLGAYYVYTMFISFFGPLVCILICYVLIAIAISKMAKISKEAQKRCLKRGSSKSVTERGLDRARRVSLIVTGLITATFIICWGPYYVTGLIEWFGKEEEKGVQPTNGMSRTARDVMLMSMYLNPMLHPIITIWLMKEIRGNIVMQCRRGGRSRRQMPVKNVLTSSKKKNNGMRQVAQNEGNGSDETKQQWI